jgi:hypothetical protein
MLYEAGPQITNREGRIDADCQLPSFPTTTGLQSGDGGGCLLDDAPSALKELLAGYCRAGAAVCALEQVGTETVFQIA